MDRLCIVVCHFDPISYDLGKKATVVGDLNGRLLFLSYNH